MESTLAGHQQARPKARGDWVGFTHASMVELFTGPGPVEREIAKQRKGGVKVQLGCRKGEIVS